MVLHFIGKGGRGNGASATGIKQRFRLQIDGEVVATGSDRGMRPRGDCGGFHSVHDMAAGHVGVARQAQGQEQSK